MLEAMALGVVPLVVDYAGPGELVDDTVGLKVPIGDRPAIIDALRRTLAAVPLDPASMGDRSRRAAARVRAEFTWHAKAHRVIEVYRSVLAPGGSPIGTAAEVGQAPA